MISINTSRIFARRSDRHSSGAARWMHVNMRDLRDQVEQTRLERETPMRHFDRASAIFSSGFPFLTMSLLAFALLVSAPAGGATLTIRVGYPQLNGGQTPLWNIRESRIDQKYGIDVHPVYIPGGVRLTQSVLSNSVDIALTGGAAVNAM